MADDNIKITQGSGTSIDTRTVGGEHRQVVVIGDPTTNANVAPVDATNGLAVDVKAITPTLTIADIQSGSISIRDILGGTVNIKDNGGSITIDGTIAVSNLAGGTIVIQDIQSGSISIRDITGGTINVVDGGRSLTIDGTIAVSDIASGSIGIRGDIAHDIADSGNPVKIGGKAYNQDGTVPGTAVVELDRANFITDLYGRQYVSIDHPYFFNATTAWSGYAPTNSPIQATPGAGLSLYITDIHLSLGSIASTVRLVENTASPTVKIGDKAFAANGGMVSNLKTPIKLSANTNLGITGTPASIGSVDISGYIAP